MKYCMNICRVASIPLTAVRNCQASEANAISRVPKKESASGTSILPVIHGQARRLSLMHSSRWQKTNDSKLI